MAGSYTYLAADLRTNKIVAELPLKQVTFDCTFNASGQFGGKLPLSDPALAKILGGLGTAVETARTALYIDRDGTLVWGGIIWTSNYDTSQSPNFLPLQGAEFLSYFDRRTMYQTFSYTNADQLQVAAGLVRTLQGVPGGNIGIVVPPDVSLNSGVLITYTAQPYELRNYGQELQTLANTQNGFDYAVDLSYVNGAPTKTLTLSYPRRGVSAAKSGLIFEYPGNVTNYSWPSDGNVMADALYGQGAGSGAAMLLVPVTDTHALDNGWPLLDDNLSFKNITTQAALDAKTRAQLSVMASPAVNPVVMLRADQDPIMGTYRAGDEVHCRFTSPRHPAPATGGAGVEQDFRILSYLVQPQDDGQGEQISVTLGPVWQG